MKKLILTGVLALLCLFAKVLAQPAPRLKPLQIGDQLPNLPFRQVLNYTRPVLRFSDFRGKALILDFWATYCGSCLAHFPVADSLQQRYGTQLQFILVDQPERTETPKRVLPVLRRYDTPSHRFTLPSISGDQTLPVLFPHHSIPHYVWVDKDHVIRAITAGEDITPENVRSFLTEGKVPEYTKKDFDHSRPLYTTEDLPVDKLEAYSIFLKGNIEGIGNGGPRLIGGTVRGLNLHNRPLLAMYQRLLPELIPGPQDSRLLLEIRDSSGLIYQARHGTYADWIRTHRYSYELVVPQDRLPHLYEDALADLNRFSPYTAIVEKRREFCWRLVRSGTADLIATQGSATEDRLANLQQPRLLNQPVFALLNYLTTVCGNAYVIDDTHYTGNIDLHFTGPARTLDDLNRNLRPYGLQLIPGDADIDMLVIRDKPTISQASQP